MKKKAKKHEPRHLSAHQLLYVSGGSGGQLIVEPTLQASADKRKQSLYVPEDMP